MPTIDEIKDYLGIDYNDDVSNRNIKKYMSVADSWLKGAIGENYPKNDERAKQLALFVIEDLYDRGSYSVKENKNIEKMKNDFIMQLQCEGRK
jgi:hypothetical protein